jgi:hypothetical protein
MAASFSLLRLIAALRSPPTARDGATAKSFCLGVGDVEFANAFTSIGEADAHYCTFAIGNLIARNI